MARAGLLSAARLGFQVVKTARWLLHPGLGYNAVTHPSLQESLMACYDWTLKPASRVLYYT